MPANPDPAVNSSVEMIHSARRAAQRLRPAQLIISTCRPVMNEGGKPRISLQLRLKCAEFVETNGVGCFCQTGAVGHRRPRPANPQPEQITPHGQTHLRLKEPAKAFRREADPGRELCCAETRRKLFHFAQAFEHGGHPFVTYRAAPESGSGSAAGDSPTTAVSTLRNIA